MQHMKQALYLQATTAGLKHLIFTINNETKINPASKVANLIKEQIDIKTCLESLIEWELFTENSLKILSIF